MRRVHYDVCVCVSVLLRVLHRTDKQNCILFFFNIDCSQTVFFLFCFLKFSRRSYFTDKHIFHLICGISAVCLVWAAMAKIHDQMIENIWDNNSSFRGNCTCKHKLRQRIYFELQNFNCILYVKQWVCWNFRLFSANRNNNNNKKWIPMTTTWISTWAEP